MLLRCLMKMLLPKLTCDHINLNAHGVRSGIQRALTSFQVQLPEKCDWPKWSRRFERFRQASFLVKEEEDNQINALIYAMGDQADDILTSFKLSATQLKRCHTVRKKFDEHFLVRLNVIFGRAKFVQHRQEEAETADMFITTLHALSERCNFGELKDEFVIGRSLALKIRNYRKNFRST